MYDAYETRGYQPRPLMAEPQFDPAYMQQQRAAQFDLSASDPWPNQHPAYRGPQGHLGQPKVNMANEYYE